MADLEYSVPTELFATHSYFPWSFTSDAVICSAPARNRERERGWKNAVNAHKSTWLFFRKRHTNVTPTFQTLFVNNFFFFFLVQGSGQRGVLLETGRRTERGGTGRDGSSVKESFGVFCDRRFHRRRRRVALSLLSILIRLSRSPKLFQSPSFPPSSIHRCAQVFHNKLPLCSSNEVQGWRGGLVENARHALEYDFVSFVCRFSSVLFPFLSFFLSSVVPNSPPLDNDN